MWNYTPALMRSRLRGGLRLLLLLVFVVAAKDPLPESGLFLIRVFRLLLVCRLVRRGTLLLVRHRRGWGRFLTQPEDLLDQVAVVRDVFAGVFGLRAGDEGGIVVVGAG